MTDKLEELKRQQAEIEQQIKLEQLKKEQESIQKQIDALSNVNIAPSINADSKTNPIRQETYKGKVIQLKDNHYKVNGVIQAFSSIEDAKKYIDSNNNYSSYINTTYTPPNNKKWLTIIFVTIGVTALLSYCDRNNYTSNSSQTGSQYITGQEDLLIDVALGKISPDTLAITHINKRFEFMGQITGRTTQGNSTVVSLENGRAFCNFTDQQQRLAVSEIGRSCWLWTGTLTSVSGGRLNFSNCTFRHC